VQEAFLRAYRSLGRLESADRFRPWLSRIAFRCAHDYLRKQVEVSMDPKDMPAETPERVTDQQRFEDAEDVRAILTRALRSLPLRLRTPLLMFHMDESTYAEISERLLISPDNAQKRVSLARTRLRDFLRRAGLEGDCRELLRTHCLALPTVPIWLDDLMSLVRGMATPAKETPRTTTTRPAAYGAITAAATLGVIAGLTAAAWPALSGGARGLPGRDGTLAWSDETACQIAIMPPIAATTAIPIEGDIDGPSFPGVTGSQTPGGPGAGSWPTQDGHTLVVSRSVGSLTHLWAVVTTQPDRRLRLADWYVRRLRYRHGRSTLFPPRSA
jgi:RNA polymerase sigma-70 factor (ECF subfamily)